MCLRNFKIMTTTILQSIEDLPISKLLNNSGQLFETHGIPENPRRITKVEFERLLKSIEDSDLNEIKPLQVIPYDNKYVVLGGNQRLRAYRKLKFKTVKCFVLCDDLDSKIYQKIIITDNSHFGSNDDDLLANMFNVDDLLDWGVELPELDIDLIPEETEGDDDVPESAPAITVKGDLYLLGEHRLLCGDSTMIDDVEKLMDGKKADMVFTDPPYRYKKMGDGGAFSKGHKKLVEDLKGLVDFNPEKFLGILPSFFKKGINAYIFCNTDLAPDYCLWAKECGYNFNILTWHKKQYIPASNNHHYPDTEYLIYISKNAIFNTGLDLNYGKYFILDNEKSEDHPTIKPIKIIINELKISSNKNSIVIDVFLGSGSTLIACEKTNRKCYGMELDEKYCDVIVKRYIEFCVKNNKDAKVYRNGELISNEVFLV